MSSDYEFDLMALGQQGTQLGIFQTHQETQSHFDNAVWHDSFQNLDPSILMEPPPSRGSCKSPSKRQSPQSSPNLGLDQIISDSVSFPAPSISIPTGSPVKKINTATYNQSVGSKPQKALFTTFPSNSIKAADKLKMLSTMYGNGQNPKSDPTYTTQPSTGKRNAANVGQLRDNNAKRQKLDEEEPSGPLPDPQDMPPVADEVDGGKPAYSYAQLIGMAILRAPQRRLTLAQIYKWIQDHFAYYRNLKEQGWMNSIRHNLSLNKAFQKTEKPKADSGKGHYWSIVPEMEHQYYKDKSQRNATNPETGYFQPFQSQGSKTSSTPVLGSFALPRKSMKTVDSSRFPAEHEISSDGTIPASDPPVPEEKSDRGTKTSHKRKVSAIASSPPAIEITSSPPVAHMALSGPTPRKHMRFSSTSRSRERHEKFRDSGFYSSVESSAPRLAPNQYDRHRPKTSSSGRAEDEIRRIRHSSFDPNFSEDRAPSVKPASRGLPLSSSSPVQSIYETGFPPLTPGITLKPRARPPQTISPNTHLFRHRAAVRELFGTPANGPSPLHEVTTYSPAFAIAEENHSSPIKASMFSNENVFLDLEDESFVDKEYLIDVDEILRSPTMSKPILGREPTAKIADLDPSDIDNEKSTNFNQELESLLQSPLAKKTPISNTKRPGMVPRASASPNVLSDVTNQRRNTRLASPIHISPPKNFSVDSGSPKKKREPTYASPAKSLRKLQHAKMSGKDNAARRATSLNESSNKAFDPNDIWCEGDSTCSGSNSENESSKKNGNELKFDISKGFRGIGAANPAADKENIGQMGPPPRKMAKTELGKSPRQATLFESFQNRAH